VAGATVSLHAVEAAAVQSAGSAEVSDRLPIAFALEAPRASCTPLRPGRFKLELTASQALHDKLMQLQHLLQHQVPGGDLAVIVERACDVLLEKTMKQRFAQVSKPRSTAVKSVVAKEPDDGESARAIAATDLCAQMSGTEPELTSPNKPHRSTRSRYVSRAVLRDVYARDGGQCTFTSPAGHRCSERGNLEVHHVRAFALGGEATVDNLKLLCRGHNGFFADKDFGATHMRMKRASPRRHGDQGVLWDG